MFREFRQVAGQLPAFGVILHEAADRLTLGEHQFCRLAQTGCLCLTQLVADEVGRDVHAVEHITDVVQYTGRHLGHARAA